MQDASQARFPMIVFDGRIQCESPVSFVLHNVKGKAGQNLIPQPMMRTADGERLYINAPAIRSAFRHAATEHVIELMGSTVHLDDYFDMAFGGIKDAKKGENGEEGDGGDDGTAKAGKNAKKAKASDVDKSYILKYAFAKERNPLMMLFGSWDIPGLLECGHALATTDVGPITTGSVRANDFRRDPEIVNLLHHGAIDDFVARQTAAAKYSSDKKSLKALDAEIRAATSAGNDDLAASLREQKTEIDGGKSGIVQLQQPLQYQAIPAGTVLSHTMRLRRVSELELALMVQAIARWGLDPVIGGKRNHGLGHVSGNWNVRARMPGSLQFEDFGSLTFGGENGLAAAGRIAEYLDVEKIAAPIREGRLDFRHASLAKLA